MSYDALVLVVARAFEMAGIIVMVVGSVAALARYPSHRSYHQLRRQIALSILLGLELLIAADIVAMVTIDPNLTSITVLGMIVLIRTFLSLSLEMETTGRWPWQRGDATVSRPEH